MEDKKTKKKDFTFNNIEYVLMYRLQEEGIAYGIYNIPTKNTLCELLYFGVADSVDDAINNFTTYGVKNE